VTTNLLSFADVRGRFGGSTRSEALSAIGRHFIAAGLIALGLQHFVFDEFITGRAPEWPASVPGKLAWAYLSGATIIAAGFAIMARRHARLAALFVGTLVAVWALLRHVPIVATDSLLAGSWTRAGKALVFLGGTFALAATLPPEHVRNVVLSRFINARGPFIVLGRICLGIFLLVSGMQHFKHTTFVASLIPTWFPGDAVFWTYFAGVTLIGGGLGLLIPRTASLAAALSGLMIFSWFWIVHVPRTFASVSDGIAVFEALTFSGFAFLIAGYVGASRTMQPDPSGNDR
jgi:uncharacterized membrane protein